MRTRLQTRFILAGCLLVMTTVGSSVWSALTFARLSVVVDQTLRESQETIDLTAEVAGSLEREDDAPLLALSGKAKEAAQEQLEEEQKRGDEVYRRLNALLARGNSEQRALALDLRREIDAYREAVSDLLDHAGEPNALKRYHDRVNPRLRQAVATCGRIREASFREMREAGVRARDEATRATGVVVGVSVGAILLATAVAVWLARSVVRPVHELTVSVEAVRQGDFDRRLPESSADELGQLAAGFNRMAETLGEYRRSSLGELLAAKATLESTLDALPDAVLVIAPDGTLAALNPPARAILEATGTGTAQRLAELPFAEEHRAAVEAALGGRPPLHHSPDFQRTFNVRFHDRPLRFLLTAVPIPEFEPRRFGAAVVLADVTDLARLDELRTELIGVASHELKSPLTTLRMNLLMLGEKSGGWPERDRQVLAAAVQGCEELSDTIEELLDVTRIEAGQLRLNLAPVDLEAVLAAARRGLEPRFDDARVRLHVVREGTAVVVGDAARLASVFSNLLTNALKYSPSGGAVTVRVASEPDPGTDGAATVQVTVTDQGPGVPAEFRERVFEKFFRVEHHLGQRDNGVRGTGIGLYLCREP
jgi:NtrC-family two-component system sensor histidine kinase KinB